MNMELKYSIDKIKLYIHGIKIDLIQSIINDLTMDMNVKAYESKSITSCRYNFLVKESDVYVFGVKVKGNSFYVGIEPNWSKDRNKNFRDIVVEYNPNKISLSNFTSLKYVLPIDEYRTEIMSIDVAADIYDYHINDLVIYKRHGNEYKCTLEHSKIETVYLGAFGENGHIKIYNKAKEQKLNDGMKWTRYEITYKKLGFMDVRDIDVIESTKLAEVRIINKEIEIEGITDTERFILLSTIDNVSLIDSLGRKMKTKIKNYHKYLEPLQIDLNKIIEIYQNFNII